jgi:hypothetical protein
MGVMNSTLLRLIAKSTVSIAPRQFSSARRPIFHFLVKRVLLQCCKEVPMSYCKIDTSGILDGKGEIAQNK